MARKKRFNLPMQAIILAAGFGTRLRPFSELRPKPLFPVLNRPLLHHLLDMVAGSGCERIVVNVHHLADQVEESLGAFPEVLVQQEEEILGTGGSLRRALAAFSGAPILVMNGDICHSIDPAALYEAHLKSGNGVTMAMHDHGRFNSVGVRGNRVCTFQPAGSMKRLAFTGIHVVDPKLLAPIPENTFFHIIDLYEQLAAQGRVGLYRVDGAYWRDMGTPEDYLCLHEELLSKPGIVTPAPESRFRDGWLIGTEVRLEQGVELRGWGCIGNRARIGKSAVLTNCVIWDEARVPAGSCLNNRIVPV